ncbi:dynein intermediate chain 2, ciliary-like [Oscarella lobularis]|uniref:dynein intermediate chain 2, ciliary-like n=1 Tax=Oscarella lobularis TaxID=121494 RepID=UPI003313B557
MRQSKSKLKAPSRSGLAGPNAKLIAGSKVGKHFRGLGREDEDGGVEEDPDEQWLHPKVLQKPSDQLQLSEQELKEEFTRILTANNPHAPSNIVRYNFKDRQYKPTSSVDQLALHFSLDGNMVHKESDEARRQYARQRPAGATSSQMSIGVDVGEDQSEGKPAAAAVDEEPIRSPDDVAAGTGGVVAASPPHRKKVMNQFNYSNRATQTYNNPYRDRGVMTEPPPRGTFSAFATQWGIHDTYVEDLERQEKEKEKKQPRLSSKDDAKKKKTMTTEFQSDDISRLTKPAKIIERMVNQNIFDDIAQDFKYWEDASDEFKGVQGTLLPLWRFSSPKTRKLTVTAVAWNPKYSDLMAVGFGSYVFLNQVSGIILFYSLKNPSYPEFIIETPESGVLCLDIHPEHPTLFAVGFYDGSVAIYDIKQSLESPLYRCDVRSGQHLDPAWEIRWQKNDFDDNLNFYSVGADGRVVNWTIVKNELRYSDALLLKIPSGPTDSGPGGIRVQRYEHGRCFDFHPTRDDMYIVGTEDGRILQCSKGYSTKYIETFSAHSWVVYAVRWNTYHPKIFASCSADWKVKVWDRTQTDDPVFTFDLNCSVRDLAWAPFSSTVFAAVTSDGKVHVFDLNLNKYEAICEQKVTRKKKSIATHIAFNPVNPIIIIGDDGGNVTSLKLSPNLRKALAEKSRSAETEIAKMDKLLSLVREIKADR